MSNLQQEAQQLIYSAGLPANANRIVLRLLRTESNVSVLENRIASLEQRIVALEKAKK